VVNDPLDLTVLLQVPDSNAGERAVNFETLDEDALADEAESGDFTDDTVVGGLVERDGVLSLVLDLSLRPLLLLCRLSSRAGRCSFCFGLWAIIKRMSTGSLKGCHKKPNRQASVIQGYRMPSTRSVAFLAH